MRAITLVLFLLTSLSASAVEQVQVLGLFTGKVILLIDGQRHTLAVGESSPEGVKLIAADSDKALIEVDGKRRKLTLGSHISSHYPEAKTKVVDIYPDSTGMYRVRGRINSHPVDFLVDTGASAIAMNSGLAKRLGLDYQEKGIAGLAETASAKVPVYQLKLDSVTVGKIRLYNVTAMVIEGPQPSQVLLGQSFLNQVHMKREGVLLRLEQNH